MHPTLAYQLARARSAQTKDQAQRDGLARAARRARRAHRTPRHRPTQPAPTLTAITRRVRTVLGAHPSP
jgi:hypothetical protein